MRAWSRSDDQRGDMWLRSTRSAGNGRRSETRSKLSVMRLTAAITHEPPWYVARCLEVEVASQGESVEEALANLKAALELYFEDGSTPDMTEPPIIASVEIAA